MKLGCIMVTEDRWPIIKIGLSSFFGQRGSGRMLIVADGSKTDFLRGVVGDDPGVGYIHCLGTSVTERLDIACRYAFEVYGADACTMWDDDDWSPIWRVGATMKAFNGVNRDTPTVAGLHEGYFVNLVTMQAQLVPTTWTWGASLSFNRAAWDARKFTPLSMPGYDREFAAGFESRDVAPLVDKPSMDQCHLPHCSKCGAPSVTAKHKMLAFTHGKNVATGLTGRGEPFEETVKEWTGHSWPAINEARKFLISRRVMPQQP